MSRRGLTVLGLAAAGGAGYYLYTAGGDPKVAQKQIEADAAKASRKIQSEIPGREKEAQKKGEEYAARAEGKANELYKDAQSQFKDAKAHAEDLKQKTSKELNSAVDKFDKTVEQKAAQAKSGLSSWFGGK